MNNLTTIKVQVAKEDELLDYTEIPSYLKSNNESYEEKYKDDFEMSL